MKIQLLEPPQLVPQALLQSLPQPLEQPQEPPQLQVLLGYQHSQQVRTRHHC
jgi:hypothetical protein